VVGRVGRVLLRARLAIEDDKGPSARLRSPLAVPSVVPEPPARLAPRYPYGEPFDPPAVPQAPGNPAPGYRWALAGKKAVTGCSFLRGLRRIRGAVENEYPVTAFLSTPAPDESALSGVRAAGGRVVGEPRPALCEIRLRPTLMPRAGREQASTPPQSMSSEPVPEDLPPSGPHGPAPPTNSGPVARAAPRRYRSAACRGFLCRGLGLRRKLTRQCSQKGGEVRCLVVRQVGADL